MKFLRYCFILVLLLPHFSLAAELTLYIQSAKANLMAGPGFDSKLLNVLAKGEAVTLVKEQGRWTQVNYQGSNGWISKLLLASQPPLEKVSVLQGKEEKLENSARLRASTNVTAAATRGLRADEHARQNDSDKADYNELQEMEAVEVREAEVRRFHQEGLGQ